MTATPDDIADLQRRLRFLARGAHDDHEIGDEAADMIERQAAEIERLRAGAWRPIDDEARAGIPIWLSDGFNIRVGLFANDQWTDLVKFEWTGRRDLHFVPTHWMPLPPPPSTSAGEG